MSSTLPSRSNGYAVALKQVLSREFFEAFLGDIHERLSTLELTEADYEAAIDQITTQALAIVSASITEEVDRQRETLAEIEANAEQIAEAVEQLQQNIVPAQNVRVDAIGEMAATTVQAALTVILGRVALLALIDSPLFTGEPKAPTPASGDDSQRLATTAYVLRETVKALKKSGDRMTGPLSPKVKDHGELRTGTEEFKFSDGNVHEFVCNGAVTINPTELSAGDVLQINVLFQSGSLAVSGATQWELGGGSKGASISDVGVALTVGASYCLIFEIRAGKRTGVFQ